MRYLRTSLTVLAVALLTLALGAGTALAGDSRDSRNAENTFTKWISDFPNMAGFVGGDVGDGTYAGEILSISGSATPSDPLLITADYHFYGAQHSFTARLDIVQIGASAELTGTVTDGWLQGNQAEGEYGAISCTEAPDGTCFQGTLNILRGSK